MRTIGLGFISAMLITGFAEAAIAAGPDSITVRRYGRVQRVTMWQNNGLDGLLEQVRKEEYERRHDGMQTVPAASEKPKHQETPQR